MTEHQDNPMFPAWRVAPDRTLTLDVPRLMGVVNLTPDSFSDGGLLPAVEAQVGYALRLVEEGACIIDIGGESTRPGAVRVDVEEQITRVIPLVRELRSSAEVLISVDTTRAAVAEAALDAGAHIINDVAAGTEDERMFSLLAERGCGAILMHRLRPPDGDSYSDRYAEPPRYDDVVADVRRFLLERCEAAESAGVQRDAIVIDPGLGFGKSVDDNFQLIRRTRAFVGTRYPVLGAASRKSFIGAVTGIDVPRERVHGSTAVTVAQYLQGIRLFRVHDVAAHRQALDVTVAMERSGAGLGPLPGAGISPLPGGVG